MASVAVLGFLIYWFRTRSGIQADKIGEAIISFLLGLLATLLIALVTFAVSPLKRKLEAYLASPNKGSDTCRILLVGASGSGKSAFIDHVLTARPLSTKPPTPAFRECPGTISLGIGQDKSVILADYQGEKPSQVTSNIPEEFAGSPDDRVIDAILFFVDFFPRKTDDKTKEVLDDQKLLEWLAKNPTDEIKRRLEEHKTYISSSVLEILFQTVYGKQLREIRLLITKADLIQEAGTRSLLPVTCPQ